MLLPFDDLRILYELDTEAKLSSFFIDCFGKENVEKSSTEKW